MNTRNFLLSVSSFGLLVLASRKNRAADAAGTRMIAELIWGTNSDKPGDKELKPVAPEVEKKLRIFKWQHYFAINRKEFDILPTKMTRVDMSNECRIEVTRLADDEFEIQLFGKGVPVVKKRQRIQIGENTIIGGDVKKNDDAWFVVLCLAKPGAARK